MIFNRLKIITLLMLSLASNAPTRANMFTPGKSLTKDMFERCLYYGLLLAVFNYVGNKENMRITNIEDYKKTIVFIEQAIKQAGFDPQKFNIVNKNSDNPLFAIGDSPAAMNGTKNLICDLGQIHESMELPEPTRTHKLEAWRMIIAHEMGHYVHQDVPVNLLTTAAISTIIDHAAHKYIKTPSNPILKWIQEMLQGCLTSVIIKRLLDYIAERRADSFAAGTLANQPGALIAGALFFFNIDRIQTLANAIDENPSWHNSCSYWSRYKNIITHYLFDPHEPGLTRAKRLLSAAGLQQHEIDACIEQLKPYATWFLNNRRSVLRILRLGKASKENLAKETDHLNQFLEHIAPEEKIYAYYLLASFMQRIGNIEPETWEIYHRVFEGTQLIDPIELYLTNWLKRKQKTAETIPSPACGA